MKENKKNNSAFTLVELLVVISIIALLVSILMPSLGKARESAKRIVCANNFHQIGIVQSLYAGDWDSWMPRFRTKSEFKKPNQAGSYGPWPNVMEVKVFQYARDVYNIPEEFWFCPSLWNNHKEVFDAQWSGGKLVYANAAGPWPAAYWNLGVTYLVMVSKEDSAARVTDPGDKLLGADVTFLANQDWGDPWSRIAHKGTSLDRKPAVGANRLHVDGSVNWYDSSQMAYENQPLEPESSSFGDWPEGKNTYKWNNQREWYW